MRKHEPLQMDWSKIEDAFATHLRIINDINEECERGRRADFDDIFPGNTHEENEASELRLHGITTRKTGRVG